MLQAMLDLETLGTKPGCIILSIGVVVFDRNEIIQDFQVHIDPLDSEKHGLRPEASTCMWWLDQEKEAQEALTKHTTLSLEDALSALRTSINWHSIERVWCNGASFDFPILKAAHEAVNMVLPWFYWAEMDFRTFKNLFSKNDLQLFKVQPKIKHDGLEDARAQAETILNLLNAVDEGRTQWAA